ncbi:MAG TPA: tRNA (adenosine(37)-N6)-threonylcarbamoyltransferase complex dimerization subunit type 1 TsaB [Spirochaetota bacterium]|nr:MAG: tRNA threonylcarbamoyladenosine biosynthesis protein TsaB [Spirochaetes bacterium ADurb.BinA120]HNU90731.1 tRNA (adenosine(37)-N6)-threonylcarbamoyltransferase complex dimerization subunit type 1 TsaB [Spirochaetota bacterium]HPI14247.1 tRNA (adenosine(37)-N6)-threonylcarbamoyltransferase complex dimerization subunit type 1 TsaB [Spirochaetota bacterium]HPO44514.1 tRNA (adenosine(37)-N6)-threonylcarbamoyltransferase complex dimerization subunit type 1 TsaB [Spirochaetota bacterium]HPV96
MNTLVIETSTPIELLAVSADGRVADRTAVSNVSHSVTLFSNIDAALGALGIGIRDIGLIGVGVGPGSFTGIRIAVSTARMLAQALAIPLAPVVSQLFYAVSVGASPGEFILTAFDAKKGRVFGALYRAGEDPLAPAELVPPGDYEISWLLEPARGARTIAVGDGAERYSDRIGLALSKCELLTGFIPSGERACRLVERFHAETPHRFEDISKVLPFYARKSDAEVIREAGEIKDRG